MWDCAFWPSAPPLVVQPLVAEGTQFFKYANTAYWASLRFPPVASEVCMCVVLCEVWSVCVCVCVCVMCVRVCV